ncbi:MAG: hypothetical protein RL230_2287 [Pseudomonadota bacterium]|jgi:hypothetical protein
MASTKSTQTGKTSAQPKALKADQLDKLPDVAALEQLALKKNLSPGDPALRRAQVLVYDAWEARDTRSRNALAKRALKLSPFCADAWTILADASGLSPDEKGSYLTRAVAAGALSLGPGGFEEFAGHFWGFHETRPYMRARERLSHHLWTCGLREDAIAELEDMLLLNPDDNQGLRYTLLSWLLHQGDDTRVDALLAKHNDEQSAFLSWTRVLMALRAGEESKAFALITSEAMSANSHIGTELTRSTPSIKPSRGYYTLGGKDEAETYVELYGFAWIQTPGSLEWLKELPKRK